MDFDKLASIATVIGNVLIAGGLFFAVLQLKDYRRERADAAAIELARIWQESNFGRNMRLILELPPVITGEKYKKLDPEYRDAAMMVAMNIETIGLMVYQKTLKFDLVWELMGGMTLASWDRIEGWVRMSRAEQKNEKFAEWTEWLVIQMRDKKSQNSSPLYVHDRERKQQEVSYPYLEEQN